MAVEKILTYRSVSLEVPYGTDDEGNAKTVNRAIGRVQPDVSDEVLAEGMKKLCSLMDKQPERIVLTEKYNLQASV